MLGLGFPQLILILAGICFMFAGVYGLAPSLVTTRFSGRGSSSPQNTTNQQTRKQEKAERARQHAEQVKAEAVERAERERVEAIRKAEQARVDAEKQRLEAEKRQLEAEKKQAEAEAKAAREAAEAARKVAAAAAETKPAPKPILEPAATFTPPAGSLKLADIVVPPAAPAPEATAEVSNMDPELVDELFAEMFALRSTVAELVGEVHQLRSEQKPRRFVIEELSS